MAAKRDQRAHANKNAISDNEEQSKLFIEKAREIGADEKDSKADKLMGKLANLKPDPRKKERKDD